MIDDPTGGLVEAAEPDRTEVHLKESIIDFLEADVELGEHVTHVHPTAAPPDPPVATNAPRFIMPGVRDGQERGGIGPRRPVVQTRRQALPERFVRPLVVVAVAEPIKAALLGGQRAPRWPRGLGLECLMHPLVPAILLGVSGLDQLRPNPEPDPPHRERREPPRAFDAKGAPLSVRIRSGRP